MFSIEGMIIKAFVLDSSNSLEVSNEGGSNMFLVKGKIVEAFRP